MSCVYTYEDWKKEWIEPEPEDEATLSPWESLLSSPISKRASRLRASNIRGLRVFARRAKAQREEERLEAHKTNLAVAIVIAFVLLYFGWGVYNGIKP
jgi:hypothetical protein